MKCNEMYSVLDNIALGKHVELDAKTIDYLREKDLITVMSLSEYNIMNAEASKLESIRNNIKELLKKADEYEAQMNDLTEKLDSKFHTILFSLVEPEKLKQEKELLNKAKASYVSETKKKEQAQKEAERLEKIKYNIQDYIKAGNSCIKIAKPGTQKIKELKARLYRLEGEEYEKLESEIIETDKNIESAVSRFNETYKALSKKYSAGENLRSAAATLSRIKGTVEENASRFDKIYAVLRDKGHSWKSIEYYNMFALAAAMKGEADNVAGFLDDTYMLLTKEYMQGSNTKSIASILIRRETPETITDRIGWFSEIYKKIKENYSSSNMNKIIAANLSADKTKATEDIYSGFAELYTDIKKSHTSGENLKVAASILMQSHHALPDNKAKIERFDSVLKEMTERGRSSSDYYPVIAGLSLMPGTVEEIFELFDKTYRLVTKSVSGGKKAVFISASLIGSIQALLHSTEETSQESEEDTYSYRIDDDSDDDSYPFTFSGMFG